MYLIFKADPSNNDGTRDANEMTFWSVSGASEAWWSSDLKTIQVYFERNLMFYQKFKIPDSF